MPGQSELDLRGGHRPQGGAPDLGAFELDEGVIPASHNQAVPCDPAALAEAIAAANGRPGADRLELAASCDYALDQQAAPQIGLPVVYDYLEIHGNGARSARPTARRGGSCSARSMPPC